jgi:hypothetical protein
VSLKRNNYVRRGNKWEHQLIVERALGYPLTGKAEVHHADEDCSNNSPGNLVICQDKAYHALLHSRIRALAGCGNKNARMCFSCESWKDISLFHLRPGIGTAVICRECSKKKSKEYDTAHKDRIKVRRREYRSRNKDKIAKAKREYAQTHREHRKEYMKRWRGRRYELLRGQV